MYVCNPASPPEFLARLSGVIFDCDGVLVDSRDANRMYYNLIREGIGMLPITPEEEDYVHMHAVGECLDRIIPAERRQEAEDVRRNLDYRDIFPFIFLEDGLVALLDPADNPLSGGIADTPEMLRTLVAARLDVPAVSRGFRWRHDYHVRCTPC